VSDEERYARYHQGGRWQGLPVQVRDDAAPHFEPVTAHVFQRDDAEDTAEPFPDDAPDILMFGVPNKGMMAGQPTNVFLLGYVADGGPLMLVDTGDHGSEAALLDAIAASDIELSRITRIVLTHCHPDHVGNATMLKEATGAPVWAHPLEREQIERFRSDLVVDHWIEDGQQIDGDGFSVETIFTPGHSPGHVCLVEPRSRVLIAGDMISGFGSVGIFPPNGSMRQYFDSLRRLLAADEARPFSLTCPGHGPVIPATRAKIKEYIEHRQARETEVYDAVVGGAGTMTELLPIIYPGILDHLSFAARSTLQANLDKLVEDGRLTRDGERYMVAE